jgi:hypothetical protein
MRHGRACAKTRMALDSWLISPPFHSVFVAVAHARRAHPTARTKLNFGPVF